MTGMETWCEGDTLAVIPARDEAARLPAALSPLHAAGVRVLVVANGCTDMTAGLARTLGAAVIETPALDGGVGAARRLGMARALAACPDPAMILTTDADCILMPGTLGALREALREANAAFGYVEPDPDEFARLPLSVRIHGQLEERHDTLRAEIEALRARHPWNPAPCHGQSPGALIAFRAGAYRRSGGFAVVPCHEDRLMAAALERTGARIARPRAAIVRASCRLTGRAPGGMATTIAARSRADLRAEIEALGAECLRLSREVAMLRATPSTPSFIPTGDDHVPSFR